jgi:hypothetical protein
MTDAKRIEELQAQIDRLKASQPTPIDHAAAGRWKDEMREIADRRALREAKSFFSRAELAAMQSAAPDAQCREIAMRDCRAPTSPSQAGASGRVERVHTNAGLPGTNTSGWRPQTPLTNPPGTNYADKLMDAADRRDRAELIAREEAMLGALGKR